MCHNSNNWQATHGTHFIIKSQIKIIEKYQSFFCLYNFVCTIDDHIAYTQSKLKFDYCNHYNFYWALKRNKLCSIFINNSLIPWENENNKFHHLNDDWMNAFKMLLHNILWFSKENIKFICSTEPILHVQYSCKNNNNNIKICVHTNEFS